MPNSWKSDRQKREDEVLGPVRDDVVGVPCFAKDLDKNIRARSSASMSRRWNEQSHLVRWHTTTRIVSCPLDRVAPQ